CPNEILPGWEDDLVRDPLSTELWDLWTDRATTNTQVFRQLFRADPDNHITTFEEYDKFAPMNKKNQGHLADPFTPVEEVKKRLDQIKGHLVWMPLDFL
ncbi:Phospholipase, partial [Ascosphaera pollenicola]